MGNRRTRGQNIRRDDILNIAVKMFVKKGIHNTGMRDIATKLDMTAAGLYYSIESKQDIIDSIAELASLSAQNLIELRRRLGNMSPTEALTDCIRYLIRRANQNHDYLLFLNREFMSFSPRLQQSMMQGIRDIVRLFEDLLKEGVETGEFQVRNPTIVAFQVWTLHNEWALRHWFWRDHLGPEEYEDQAVEVILKQVLPPFSSSESTGSRQERSSVATDD